MESLGVSGEREDEVYVRSYRRLVRVAYLILGDGETAEDVVQEAFVAYRGRAAQVVNPDGFLRQVVVYQCRSRLRHRAVQRAALPRLVAVSADPDVTDRVAVQHALTRLSVRQRTAIVLRYYEGCSEAEISNLLQCRRGTVKSLLARGLLIMRRELSDG